VFFLLNELSLHGQFQSTSDFCHAVDRIMAIRQQIVKYGSELLCNPASANSQVTSTAPMRQAVQSLPLEKKRAWMSWLTRQGPFWTEDRQHQPNEWLESDGGGDVADTAIGEAAYCLAHGIHREVVSFDPSNWLKKIISVTWLKECETSHSVQITNHWSIESVTPSLEAIPNAYTSWQTLMSYARQRFNKLSIDDNAFSPMDGQPFHSGVADSIVSRLSVLDRLCGCIDEKGNRTPEGNYLYNQHFTGDKAWFSDSSSSELAEFANALTFPHPTMPGEYLTCSWHGKIKTPQYRIHFSWPIVPGKPVFVVYVGPKITRR